MARRPAPPSASAPAPRSTARGGRRVPRDERAERTGRSVDVREWASGIRLSGFAVIMLSLVVLGTWVLVPSLGTYLEQRQRIAALEASVEVTSEQIAVLEQERTRWDDPAFITTEARERLYYVKPGEVPYLIDDDLAATDLPAEQGPVSDEIEETKSDWMPQLLRGIVSAGLAQNAVEAPTP